jgi:hypothetical protein
MDKKQKQVRSDISFMRVSSSTRKTARGRGKKKHITIVGIFWNHAKNVELKYDYTAAFNAIMDRRRKKLPVKGLIYGARRLKEKHKELGHPITETRQQKRRRVAAFINGG